MKSLLAIIGCAVLIFTIRPPVQAAVKINEFMALNLSTYPDMCDYDDFSDWIELYNSSDTEVSLDGFYLTDNFNLPRKWTIPADAKIAGKGFLVIRADGADNKPGVIDTLDSYPWNVPFTTKRYHTNFKLNSEGEEIGLFKASGIKDSLVDSVTFSNQLADVSLGRDPANPGTWLRFDQPTPGSANGTDGKNTVTYSGSVAFSLNGGFYTEPQTLTMTTTAGEIHYTTDGSTPHSTSATYTAPLSIDKNTVVRARCFEPDKLASKSTTSTFFINEKKRSLMMVAITTDTAFIYSKELGVFENSWKGREVPVTIEFFTPDGKEVSKVNAGMTLGSMTNFTCPQKPLQIALKGKYGDDFIWYQLFDKPIACFPRLRLRQGGDAWSTNLISDGVLEAMSKGQLDFGIQAYRPVIVFINGQYYGLHDLREQFDDQYFTNNYGVDPTSKDEVRSTFAPLPGQTREVWEQVSGTWSDYQSVIDLVKTGDMTDEKYARVAGKVNINSLVDFVSAVVYGKQISWGHNEDLWKVNTTKWQWLTTDFDRSFVYKDNYADITFNNFTEKAGVSGSLMEQDTLFLNLMKNDTFKNYFAQRLAAHCNSTFHPARMTNIADSLALLLSPEMAEYTAKWSSKGDAVKSVTAWNAAIDTVKLFMNERTAYIMKFLTSAPFNYAGTARLTVKLSKANTGDIYVNGVRMCQRLDKLSFVTGAPMQVKAVARPGYVFAGWAGGPSADTLTVTLSGDSTITANFEVSEDHAVPSSITENTTLNLTDHPYIAPGDIVVAKGATLTIEKGVTLLLPQDAELTVKGKLVITGTADAQVTIRENAKAGATNWGSLNFDTTTEANSITYAVITGTNLGKDALNERGGINGNQSNLVMDHLTMYNVVYPMYFEGGTTTIKNSRITVDHMCNGAIHVGRGGAIVENNIWYSTGVTMNTDAIDIKGVVDGIVRGNLVYNFNGPNSDAIDLGETAQNILIADNIVYGSYDKGMSVGGKSTAVIKNNLVVGCDLGIGIKDEGSYAELDHNTFVRNRIGIAVYSKAFGRGGGKAKVTNCILAASKSSSYFADQYSTATFSHCLSDVDILPGTGNIMADPHFVDILKNNFQLQPASPCINKGDPAYEKDADGTVTDIGAQYSFDSTDFPIDLVPAVTPPPVVFSEIMYNDASSHNSDDWIELYNTTGEDIPLAGFKMTNKGDYDNWIKSTDLSLVDSTEIFTFPENASIPAHGYIVICRRLDLFKTSYANVPNCMGDFPFKLDGAKSIFLYNATDELVNVISYKDVAPWPTAPDGKGPSLELINAEHLNYLPYNWAASKEFGTPGKANTASGIAMHPSQKTVPTAFLLAQNFPNPCKVSTTIQYALPEKCPVTLSIYTISGRLMETFVNEKADAGVHQIKWDTRNIAAGVYFYRISAGQFVQTKKLTVQ